MGFYIPYSTSPYTKKTTSGMSSLFNTPTMKREVIVKFASKMTSTHDLLILLNRIKMDELGDKGHPFTMPQLNYFINPKRNKDHYRSFTIPKRSGGVRTISAPNHILKSLLTYTNRILQAFYEAPDYVTGFVPTKSVVDNAERHIGMNYVFNTDLKDFFPSIPQARVWGALQCRPFGFNEKIASAIAGLCCTEIIIGDEIRYALPQGSPCSPILTNIVCHNLDWKLNGLARRFHLRYSRYADDITFSSDQNVYQEDGEFMTELRKIVAEQNFTLNEKKTRLQKRGSRQEVTGLVVSDRVNVAREYVRDLDNLLYIWERHGRDSAFAKFIARYIPKQDLHRKEADMVAVIQGKLMYLRMVKGDDNPVWRRLQKRFNRLVDQAESTGGTDLVYLHSYSIYEFENLMGSHVKFFRLSQEDAPQEQTLAPFFALNGAEHHIKLSRYARTRLTHILENGDAGQMKAFKRRFRIGYCKDGINSSAEPFWLIYRGMRKKDNKTQEKETKEEAENNGLSTDEMLETLINSEFDLSTLKKWAKTRDNN